MEVERDEEFRPELIELLNESIEEDDDDDDDELLFFEEPNELGDVREPIIDLYEGEDLPNMGMGDDRTLAPIDINLLSEGTRAIPDKTPRFVIQQTNRGSAGRSSKKRVGQGGRAAGQGLRTERSNLWQRGQPLIEKFVSDEKLPSEMRQHIANPLSDRTKRERNAQRRKEAFLQEMDDQELDENEQFFDAEEFEWNPVNEWTGVKEEFVPDSTGPTVPVADSYDAFRKYWDDEILSHIVVETNRCAQLIGETSASFKAKWYDTSVDELLVLFSFWMMLAVIRMPTIRSCFSNIPIMRTEVFRYLLPESRYWNLNRAFSLANDTGDANNRNVLFSMGPIIAHLNNKFQQNYKLQRDICIDESLTVWKGPVGFRQYIKTKSDKSGIKSYQLCESATGYLWSFFIYVGKATLTSAMPVSFSHVRKLVEPLLNLGHTLFLDNWFNSPALARFLKQNKTDCVGTLRSNRKAVPPVIDKAPLQEGEFIARQSGDVMVVTLQDRRRVSLISTCHGLAQVHKPSKSGRPSHYRLQLVEDYNRGMGGVGKVDQMLETYLMESRKSAEWTKKMFKRLLGVSIQNSRILLERTRNKKLDFLAFRIDLVEKIIKHHLHRCNVERPVLRTTSRFPQERLTGRHFIRRTPVTESMKANVKTPSNRGKRRCVWCSANNVSARTVYECPDCDVPLCVDFCFKAYHTEPDVPNRSSL